MNSRKPTSYIKILSGLKAQIREARVKAALSLNSSLMRLYWEIGRAILKQQQEAGWGAKIIERLASDLKREFPDMQGLSVRNLKYMRAFAEAYPQFVQPPVAQIASKVHTPFIKVQQLVAQLPWAHNVVLLDRTGSQEERIFYAQKSN